jgi:hypothetical protein
MDEEEELEEVQLDIEEEDTSLTVIMEDGLVHDGEHLCGDSTCPCFTLGYPD